MSATPSATIALSRICFSAERFSSSLRFLSMVVCLLMAALIAEKNAISVRSTLAWSNASGGSPAYLTVFNTAVQDWTVANLLEITGVGTNANDVVIKEMLVKVF